MEHRIIRGELWKRNDQISLREGSGSPTETTKNIPDSFVLQARVPPATPPPSSQFCDLACAMTALTTSAISFGARLFACLEQRVSLRGLPDLPEEDPLARYPSEIIRVPVHNRLLVLLLRLLPVPFHPLYTRASSKSRSTSSAIDFCLKSLM